MIPREEMRLTNIAIALHSFCLKGAMGRLWGLRSSLAWEPSTSQAASSSQATLSTPTHMAGCHQEQLCLCSSARLTSPNPNQTFSARKSIYCSKNAMGGGKEGERQMTTPHPQLLP